MKSISLILTVSILIASFSMSQVFAAAALPGCACNGAPALIQGGMCICGCPSIQTAFNAYSKDCPQATLDDVDKKVTTDCDRKKYENTEDCPVFRNMDGKIRDLYKKCNDVLDSVQDDCEECIGCKIIKAE